jgi:hypothetical protein
VNTSPARHPPGGAFHVAHTLTATGAMTLTLNDAEHYPRQRAFLLSASITRAEPFGAADRILASTC